MKIMTTSQVQSEIGKKYHIFSLGGTPVVTTMQSKAPLVKRFVHLLCWLNIYIYKYTCKTRTVRTVRRSEYAPFFRRRKSYNDRRTYLTVLAASGVLLRYGRVRMLHLEFF